MTTATRRRGTAAATLALAFALGLAAAGPADAAVRRPAPMYKTMAACKAARATYTGSFVSPASQCGAMYLETSKKLVGYTFDYWSRY